MNIRHSISIVLLSVVLFSTNAIAKDIAIYRWIDENNVVHFSQHQPKNANFSQLTTFSSYKAKKTALPQKDNLPSVDEQLSKYEKDKAEVLAKNEEIAEKNCSAAKLNIKTLNSFDNVMFTDLEGKSRTLSDKEKKAQLTLSKKHIKMYCAKKS